jgi:hypothetical protein
MARLARAMRVAPTMSGDFSRSNARGRSDLHSPNDAWTSQTHGRPGIRQDRRGMSAASSPFRQNGDSRLARPVACCFANRWTGLAGRVRSYASKVEIRETRQVLGGPGDRQAPTFHQESEGGKAGFGGECADETTDAAKWVHRPNDCAAKARNRRGINMTAGPCGRPTAESAKRRREALLHEQNRRASFSGCVVTGCNLL